MAFLDKTGLAKLWIKIKATFAKKEDGIYFVNGTQTSSTNVWTGSIVGLTALYDGLTINYYLPYAGTSTGATLNINGLGAYPVYRYGRTTQITTHFAAGSMIKLTFRTSYKVAGTTYTNAWIADSFYDSNSYAYVRQYTTTTDADYPLLFAYETTLPSSYDTKYTRKASEFTYNPKTGTLSVAKLKLDGSEVELDSYANKSDIPHQHDVYIMPGSGTAGGLYVYLTLNVKKSTTYSSVAEVVEELYNNGNISQYYAVSATGRCGSSSSNFIGIVVGVYATSKTNLTVMAINPSNGAISLNSYTTTQLTSMRDIVR